MEGNNRRQYLYYLRVLLLIPHFYSMILKKIWTQYSNLGIRETTSEREGIKVRLLNQITVVSIIVNSIVFVLTGLLLQDFTPAIGAAINNIVSLVILFLNSKGFVVLTRHLCCIIFPIWLAVIIAFSLGIGAELKMFILCAVFCFIQYEGQIKLKLFSLGLIIFLVISSSFSSIYYSSQSSLFKEYVTYADVALVLASIVMIFMMLTFYQLDIQRFSKQKNRLVKQLKSNNEELERFAYITSHDLKEPVKNIQSFASILKKKIANSQELKKDIKLVEVIDYSAQRMSTMIDAILKFSKIDHQELSMEKIDLDPLVEEFKDTYRALLKSKSAVVNYTDLPVIKGNKLLLSLLFQNLIENGIKYNKSSKPVIQIFANIENDFVKISIKDNGIGIEKEFQKKIFEPFKRLHSRGKYEGTGLGLSICKKIVEAHSGEIWVETNEETGSTFMLHLPLSQN